MSRTDRENIGSKMTLALSRLYQKKRNHSLIPIVIRAECTVPEALHTAPNFALNDVYNYILVPWRVHTIYILHN
jgi:hypothetical protein